MPRRLAPAALLACTLALTGCFQFRTVLRLDADGRGTIEETFLFSELILSMMQGDSTRALYDEAALAARADSFGTGVRFVGVDSLAEGGFTGYRAVYAFDDVNAVRLTLGESGGSDLGGEDAEDATEGAAQNALPALAFTYEGPAPGAGGRLRITIPREEGEAGAPLDSAAVAAQAEAVRQQVQEAALLRGFLEGARIAVTVELPGPVAETNARYVEGRTLTLVDLGFGAFLDLMEADPELAARLQLAETPEDREAVLRALNEHPGLRFEPEEEVFVRLAD
jgi:hypothetical protein